MTEHFAFHQIDKRNLDNPWFISQGKPHLEQLLKRKGGIYYRKNTNLYVYENYQMNTILII
jgi:hypothetical protein